MTPITLTYDEVIENAKALFLKGNLQALRAQTGEIFTKRCYNTHPQDTAVKCVIGASLDAEPGSIKGVEYLINMKKITCTPEDGKKMQNLQLLHDGACSKNIPHRNKSFDLLKTALGV